MSFAPGGHHLHHGGVQPKLDPGADQHCLEDDATYRLTWQKYPIFVSGRSHPSVKLFPAHVTLASHEDTRAWASSYLFVKEKATPR